MVDMPNTVNRMVALIIAFHEKTGAPIDDIKAFVKDVGDITSEFTMQVIKGEMNKAFHPEDN